MDSVAELLDRNSEIANDHDGGLPFLPSLRTVIVACPDHRSDPAQALGLEAGEAAVIRTVGGRVTPAMLQNLALMARVVALEEGTNGGFELVIMHHTDCGITRLQGAEDAEGLAAYLGVAPAELPSKAVGDPFDAVRADLAELAANPLVPGRLSVSGMVYDVETGKAELVERRSPLRDEG